MRPPTTPLEAFIRTNLSDVIFAILLLIVTIEITAVVWLYISLVGPLPAHPF